MKQYYEDLNSATVEVYEYIGELERITSEKYKLNISIGEIHLMDRIYRERGISIKRLASQLNLTTATVTVRVQRMVARGYIVKSRNLKDLRGVTLDLTREGVKVIKAHHFFHVRILRAMTQDLSEEEITTITKSLEKVSSSLKEYIRKEKEKL